MSDFHNHSTLQSPHESTRTSSEHGANRSDDAYTLCAESKLNAAHEEISLSDLELAGQNEKLQQRTRESNLHELLEDSELVKEDDGCQNKIGDQRQVKLLTTIPR